MDRRRLGSSEPCRVVVTPGGRRWSYPVQDEPPSSVGEAAQDDQEEQTFKGKTPDHNESFGQAAKLRTPRQKHEEAK